MSNRSVANARNMSVSGGMPDTESARMVAQRANEEFARRLREQQEARQQAELAAEAQRRED